MTLENQVCSVEQAKKLESLGIDGGASLYWTFDSGLLWKIYQDGFFDWNAEGIEIYPAYTVAELGIMLPLTIEHEGRFDSFKHKISWQMCYRRYQTQPYIPSGFVAEGATEAEGRANLLIHLLESGKITASEVNESLSAS